MSNPMQKPERVNVEVKKISYFNNLKSKGNIELVMNSSAERAALWQRGIFKMNYLHWVGAGQKKDN